MLAARLQFRQLVWYDKSGIILMGHIERLRIAQVDKLVLQRVERDSQPGGVFLGFALLCLLEESFGGLQLFRRIGLAARHYREI